MSKAKKRSIYTARNSFTDRARQEVENFSELPVRIQGLDTALLLLDSEEETVLIGVFQHLADFARKQEENVAVLREKNLLELLQRHEFWIEHGNRIVRRFALYIATVILESVDVLREPEPQRMRAVLALCLRFYLQEKDDFCLEYLSVVIDKCLEDPQAALAASADGDFLEKFFALLAHTDNPDVLLHSAVALRRLLLVQDAPELSRLLGEPGFPADRLLCELTSEFAEVRSAALKVVRLLVADQGDPGPLGPPARAVFVLQQLTRVLCEDAAAEGAAEVVDVLAAALRAERLARLFFEQNLFDRVAQHLEAQPYELATKCRALAVFAEAAQHVAHLARLQAAHAPELFLECLLGGEGCPATHVVAGLNRLMRLPEAAQRVVDAFDRGVVAQLLNIILDRSALIKTREQAAELLVNLLLFAFHGTAAELIGRHFPDVVGDVFAQGLPELSIDLVLALLSLVESLAQNGDYRLHLGASAHMTRHLAALLKNSFGAAIVVNNIFRCLCTLVDEPDLRARLLALDVAASVRRGLCSLANLVKTSVTNFVMQTTRFPEFVREYVDAGVLEVLIMHQKHSFCVPTWGPAIESVLSKVPSLKFCIRHQLGFTDSTAGQEFLVSQRRFDDFRVFQCILREEVSPLHPVLVVDFERPENPPDQVVTVPKECLSPEDLCPEGWCYCRHPGDDRLPLCLERLHRALEAEGLVENPPKVQRAIDFDSIARRARIVAEIVAGALDEGLRSLDLTSGEECAQEVVRCHLRELNARLHCNFIPLGLVRTGCRFERAVLFKALADQIGLPCTLQRSVDGRVFFNELPLPVELDQDEHCDRRSMRFLPWRLLRPTHIVDLLHTVGDLYPLQSRQALQYLRLC